MTDSEKIDVIMADMAYLKAHVAADKEICRNVHEAVNERINALHRVVKGNGRPGLEGNLAALTTRFDKFEAKIIAYSAAAVLLGQIMAPKVLAALGLGGQ